MRIQHLPIWVEEYLILTTSKLLLGHLNENVSELCVF